MSLGRLKLATRGRNFPDNENDKCQARELIAKASEIFSEVGTLDTHTVRFNWDDGTAETLGASASASHNYAAAGVYTVRVTVTDDDTGVASTNYEFTVVYDPNGGFVTVGGWINSPAGAYRNDAAATGKASFGFVSKYLKGANVPTGATVFQFHTGNFSFESSAYEWLVVSGASCPARCF